MSKPISIGFYKHYTGKIYFVEHLAKHTETLEELVIYRSLDKANMEFWARPVSVFNETVNYNNQIVLRFEKLSKEESKQLMHNFFAILPNE